VIFREIQAKSLLRRQKRVDSWFLSSCGLNLYRGCGHDCAYCDGRAEKYAVEGEFGREIQVKLNAVALRRRERDRPRRRRAAAPAGFVLLGGGVGDSYQPAEERYGLARRTLELLLERKRPVHVLTKSMLVERDLDLLRRLHEQTRVILSMSFSSVDDELCARFEPGVPPPQQRLDVLSRFRQAGSPVGVYLMPVLPLLSDTEEQLERTVGRAAEAGVGFIVFGGLTLKPGRQMEHYLEVLAGFRPELEVRCRRLYAGNPRGSAAELRFAGLARRNGVPLRIPPALYGGVLSAADRALVTLEHLDYLLRLRGERSPYGAAARELAARPEIAEDAQQPLFPELAPEASAVLDELRRTGRSTLLERLLEG